MPKYRLPRLAGQSGKLFRRSSFLEGRIKTYFAPGQRPYMIGTLDPRNNSGVWSVGTPATDDDYTNPTDWPQVGNLLRPPQVVWLEIRIGAAGSESFMQDPFVHEWLDTAVNNLKWETQANYGRREHLRLAPIFAAVKARIEAIRPHVTFVEVADWCAETNVQTQPYDVAGSPTVTTWTSLLDNQFEVGQSTGAGFIQAPAFSGSFFGVDFLSIFCGDALINGIYMNRQFGTSDPNFPIGGSCGATDLASNPFWAAAYGRLKIALPKFHRYSSRLYHPPSSYRLWEQKDIPPDPPDDDSNIVNGALAVWLQSGPNFDQAASIAAADKIDITHPGDSTIITADYLVNLIAAHYGFDPSTGRDL